MQEGCGSQKRSAIISSFPRVPLILSVVVLVLSGCTPASVAPEQAVVVPSESASPELGFVDPLIFANSPDSDMYVESVGDPVIHERGNGPTEFSVPRPPAPATGVVFMLSCSAPAQFTITMDKFFSGPCDFAPLNSGGIPIPPGDDDLSVTVDVPVGVEYWLVGLPTA